MKNKKGFTLPELMGVIVILGIIGLIIFPVIDKSMKESNKEVYDLQIKNIELGAMNWATENLYKLPKTEGEKMFLTLAQLKQSGNVKNDIKNTNTNKMFSNNMLITITKTSNGYKYFVDDSTNDLEIDSSLVASIPSIILNGNILEYVELNSNGTNYIIPTAEAKFSDGSTSSDIIVTIKKEDTIVDRIPVNTIGNYTIRYSWIKDNLSTSYIKTIIVKDTTPPELTIPADSTISTVQVATLNLNLNVSGKDNSGQTPTIEISGSVYAVPGKYTITYTATDSYNNKTVKKRIITVQ